ncbi:MAG: glycosyltransferase family 2 protein [Actinomycetota bacterium]|nr:glycosyltransferase family 2 protein [Actinomycetota bacterium]
MPGRKPLPPPHSAIRISVVVPARNEEALISSCLAALAEQKGIFIEEYEVLLVLDRCTDATEDQAMEVAAEHPDLRLHLLEGPGRGAGHARRVGMEKAYARLLASGRPDGLIASTDADTVVAPDWLSAQLAAASRGARAIGGRIELRDDGDLAEDVVGWRAEQGRLRQRELLAGTDSADGPLRAEHWQFSGASLALTAAAYAEIGGLEPLAALEDEYLERALSRCGIPIERPLSVKVATSARLVGRAERGLARDLALASWVHGNTYDAHDFDAWDLLEKKHVSGVSVSVVVPMRGKGRGTAALLDALGPLAEAGLVDEKIVLCPEGEEARSANGAKVYRDADLMPGFGPVRGYGDALWRGLSIAEGDVVLFLDPSVPDPEGRRTLGLLGPLLSRHDLSFVKGFSAQTNGAGDLGVDGLSELVARPLINLYRPELAGFVEPFSSEFAARRTLLASLSFPAGYGAALSLLLDAASTAGVRALAQTRLGPRSETGVSLPDLGEAAYATLVATAARTHGKEDLDERAPGPLFLPLPGRFELRRVAVEERPPLDSL